LLIIEFIDKPVSKINVNFLAKFEEIFVINKIKMGKNKRIKGEEGARRRDNDSDDNDEGNSDSGDNDGIWG